MGNGHKTLISSRRDIPEVLSEESEDPVLMVAERTSGSENVKWNLRPRDSSDHSSQPHPAPSDIVAQQSENFRRFYRAVVSPTHVRVTAGGRIVPNTRAAGTPQFEWDGEKNIIDHHQPSSEIESKPLQVPGWSPGMALTQGFPQLFPAGFIPSYSCISQPNPHPLATMRTQNLGTLACHNQTPAPRRGYKTGAAQSANDPQPIKISHPSQFDHSKPFLLNGQLVYPILPGQQQPSYTLPFANSISSNSNTGPSIQHPTAFLLPQPLMPVPYGALNTPSLDLNPAIPNLSVNQPVGNFAPYNPYISLASPVSVADITKSQIESFRNHLNFINDQLANNPHEVDAQYMKSQRADIVAIIDKMETMLTIQLAYEQKQDAGAYVNGTLESGFNGQPTKVSVTGDADKTVLKDKGTALFTMSRDEPIASCSNGESRRPSSRPARNEDDHGTDGTCTAKGPSPLGSIASKSRLTRAAAMAPPFQPRTQAMVATNSFDGISTGSSLTPSFSPQAHENRATNASSATYSSTIAETTHAALLKGGFTQNTSVCPQKVALTSQGGHEIHGELKTSSNSGISTTSRTAVPYLVGTFPQGIQGNMAKTADLQYPRPLTDEELRARFLYWGRAPRSAYGNLPKFDGKDFYPPSPTKEISHPQSDSNMNTTDDRLSPVIFNFERLFTIPENATYKALSSPTQNKQIVGVNPAPNSSVYNTVRLSSQSPSTPPNQLQRSPYHDPYTDYQGPEPTKHGPAIQPSADNGKSGKPRENFPEPLDRDGLDLKSLSSPQPCLIRSNLDIGTQEMGSYTSLDKKKPAADHENADENAPQSIDSLKAGKIHTEMMAEGNKAISYPEPRIGAYNKSSRTPPRFTTDIRNKPAKSSNEQSLIDRVEGTGRQDYPYIMMTSLLICAQLRTARCLLAEYVKKHCPVQGIRTSFRDDFRSDSSRIFSSIPGLCYCIPRSSHVKYFKL